MAERRMTISDALRQAMSHHQAGRHDVAAGIYRQILEVQPEHADALHLLGVLALQADRHGEAAELIQRAVAAAPDRAAYHGNLGVALFALGEPEAALVAYERALELGPDEAETLNNLGNVLQALGRAGEAEAAYRRALAIDPGYVRAHNNLGTALRALGRPEAAEASYRRAVELAPTYADARANLGVALNAQGRSEEAVTVLRQALEIAPESPVVHNHLGNALHDTGALDDAADAFRRAIELDAEFSDAIANLASVLREQGRLDAALALYDQALRLNRLPGADRRAPPDTFRQTARAKLDHDIEQLTYLMEQGILPDEYRSVVADYEAVRAELANRLAGQHKVTLPPAARNRLAPTYNRLIHVADAPAIPGGALNPALDGAAIEADYRRNAPGITFIDGLLRPEALDSLRRFCLESTIWFDFRYADGYLGSFMQDGFCCPLLVQISQDLRGLLPGLLDRHELLQLWGFKYDSRLSGIPKHADFAAVNVNFWITPDDANLNPEGGGLNLWDKEAPADWDFAKYNSDQAAITAFLEENDARMVKIPHRQNRAAIFNSDLFHETDDIEFREGYENRRINITMLFGRRDRP